MVPSNRLSVSTYLCTMYYRSMEYDVVVISLSDNSGNWLPVSMKAALES
jgi:hypothetical protein